MVNKVTTYKNKQMDLEVWLSKRLKGLVRLDQANPAYKVGQVLALRFERFAGEVPMFAPDNDPKLQGALVFIENKTGLSGPWWVGLPVIASSSTGLPRGGASLEALSNR